MSKPRNLISDSLRRRVQYAASTCVNFTFRRAARITARYYDRAFDAIGITGEQYMLLSALAALGTPGIHELAVNLALERTTVTRNLALVQASGLVEPVPHHDRRKRLYRLTAQGVSILKKALPLWESSQEQMLTVLGRENWKSIRKRLRKVTD